MRGIKSVCALKQLIRSLLGVLLVTLIFGGLSSAQIKSGTIVGTVTDPSGAVVPGADIIVTDQGTNVASTTVSDKSGAFTVPYLQPGIYTVTVEKTGSGLTKYSAANLSRDWPDSKDRRNNGDGLQHANGKRLCRHCGVANQQRCRPGHNQRDHNSSHSQPHSQCLQLRCPSGRCRAPWPFW